jgi:hypothetical protein
VARDRCSAQPANSDRASTPMGEGKEVSPPRQVSADGRRFERS